MNRKRRPARGSGYLDVLRPWSRSLQVPPVPSPAEPAGDQNPPVRAPAALYREKVWKQIAMPLFVMVAISIAGCASCCTMPKTRLPHRARPSRRRLISTTPFAQSVWTKSVDPSSPRPIKGRFTIFAAMMARRISGKTLKNTPRKSPPTRRSTASNSRWRSLCRPAAGKEWPGSQGRPHGVRLRHRVLDGDHSLRSSRCGLASDGISSGVIGADSH